MSLKKNFSLPLPAVGGREIFSGDTLKSAVYESNPHKIQKLKDNISHAAAATKITVLHPVYLNMVKALLFKRSTQYTH